MKKKLITVTIIILVILTIIIFIIHNSENKYQYNNPIIPEGFHKLETETASWNIENGVPKGWNNGLVIEDNRGNQFVWIPVDKEKMEEFKNYNNKAIYEKKVLNNKNQEDKQIIRYGGFYVSRYEAGLSKQITNNNKEFTEVTNNKEGIPVSKKNTIPWNNISFENAKKNATLMYNTEDIKSSLITEKQYLYILSWIEKSGYNITKSKKWGNFANSFFSYSGLYSEDLGKSYMYIENGNKKDKNILLATGISENNKAKNIYDIAGNLMEYVSNAKINKQAAYGGYFDYIDQGANQSLYYYNDCSPYIGFRVVLNIN